MLALKDGMAGSDIRFYRLPLGTLFVLCVPEPSPSVKVVRRSHIQWRRIVKYLDGDFLSGNMTWFRHGYTKIRICV